MFYYGQAIFSLSGWGKNCIESASLFFRLKHLHRFSYIKLESIRGNSSNLFFILVWSFPIYLRAFFWWDISRFVVTLIVYNVIMDKRVNRYHKLIYSQKYFLKTNSKSNISLHFAYIQMFNCWYSNLLPCYNISFSNIYFNRLWLSFIVLEKVENQEKS